MPTRLEVLLQRRKSAAAELFHRHITANASAGNRPAVRRAEKGLGRWESSGIIQRSYINSLTISRGRAGAVNGRVVFSGHRQPKCRPETSCLRRDMAKYVTTSHLTSIFRAK